MSKLELPKTKEELLNLLQGLADETAELRGIVDNIGTSKSEKEEGKKEEGKKEEGKKEEIEITDDEIDEVEQLLNLD